LYTIVKAQNVFKDLNAEIFLDGDAGEFKIFYYVDSKE
jgi:hypothetical protein